MLSGLRVLLRCVQVSPRPCFWQHPPDRQTRQRLSDLEVVASIATAGTYVCYCQEGGPREQPPCKRAEYHLTLAGPSAGGNVAIAGGGRHFLAYYMLLFILGLVAGATAIYLLMHRRRGGMGFGIKGAGHGASMSEKRHDLLASSATPQSPSSASLLSEAVPLTKRNGTLNGHGGGHNGSGLNHHLGAGAGGGNNGGHNGPHIYSNNSSSSDDVKLSESSSKLGLQHNPHNHLVLEGRERPGQEGEEGEGLSEGLSEIGEGLSGLEEELAGLQMYRGAPLAQCEESSI